MSSFTKKALAGVAVVFLVVCLIGPVSNVGASGGSSSTSQERFIKVRTTSGDYWLSIAQIVSFHPGPDPKDRTKTILFIVISGGVTLGVEEKDVDKLATWLNDPTTTLSFTH
jgi:hypothetical protein